MKGAMNYNMKFSLGYVLADLSIILIAIVFINFRNESRIAAEFLSQYGWTVELHPVESEEIVIPTVFDSVYENYNNIQLEAGLDLTPYRGRNAKRYTFSVLNYPDKNIPDVRANVLVVDGVAVAGDISTVAVDGFMHSLVFTSSVNL